MGKASGVLIGKRGRRPQTAPGKTALEQITRTGTEVTWNAAPTFRVEGVKFCYYTSQPVICTEAACGYHTLMLYECTSGDAKVLLTRNWSVFCS